MGTTRDALAAGSTSFVYVAAVEGLSYLLHSHSSSAAVVTAFAGLSGGDYASALGGLFVELDNQQSIHPYEPFQGGGRCSLRVVPDAADTFGIDTHRKAAGFETELTETLNHGDTTIHVKSTSTFPSSGTVYIGTEAISYTGVTAGSSSSFTGCTRGKYSPFPAGGSEATRFANYHRVGKDAQSVDLQPVVSSQPRAWIGKRVGVWMVRVVAGVLDVQSEAQLVYAGRIVEIRDDPNTFATCVELQHVLDDFKNTTIGRDIWSAKIPAGIYLSEDMVFRMKDRNTTTYEAAGSLEVVAGASGTDEIEPGAYSVEQIHSILETWWNAERDAGRINGTYSIRIDTIPGSAEYRTKIYSNIPGAADAAVDWRFEMPPAVALLFGYSSYVRTGSGIAGEDIDHEISESPPLRAAFFNGSVESGPTFNWNRFTVYDERGVFLDSLNFMPSTITISDPTAGTGTTLEWGIFVVGENNVVFGARDGDDIGYVYPLFIGPYGSTDTNLKQFQNVPWSPNAPDYIPIRQLPVLESTMRVVLNTLCYSTGTSGYNSATYDGLPYGFSLGLPGGMLGPQFEASTNNLPGSDDKLTVVLDKPMTLSELFGGDLMLRRVFPLWRDQGLVFGSWRTPTTDAAQHTLDETNKAEPSGSEGTQRSALAITDEWQRPVVKILYDRNFNELGSESYASVITLEDRTAVDDAGGVAQTLSVKARNASGDVTQLAANFLATMPMFSRPTMRITRSIDPRYFEEIAVGDVVILADDFTRDPSTGIRGIAARPALVIKHRWNPGGMSPGATEPNPMGGEVELLMTERNATLSGALYAPAADIDDTHTTGGYTAGYDPATKTIKCYERRYNQSVEIYINGWPVLDEEVADASYFAATYKVKVIERDPASSAAPQVWEDTVVSQTGNFVTLTTGLAGFDTTKKYRIVFDDYDAAITIQKTKAYQADDADGMVLNSSSAYSYSSGSSSRNYDANAATPEIELIPASVFADGAGRDVGHESALSYLLDNLIDYKTALNMPVLFNTVRTNIAIRYKCIYLAPLMLTREGLSNAVIRELSVAPWFRSADGRVVSVRVTLMRDRPTTTSLHAVNRGTVYSEMTRSTSSTTWQKASASQLDCRVKSYTGLAWLMIEASQLCQVRGLHQCSEGPRTQPIAWTI